jgi:hypothetical protein
MKLATVERPIDRISTNTERQFTIKATGKAFRILSSSLYKEKILAIVRELSCNAFDAHVSAGWAARPFDVHLPNNFEPFFSVRDYGPALSPDQIANVFTTYFESTKTETNDQIGGFGLGCKSPLAYVDSFTVISRFEGFKRTYTVFFDEQDTPSIVLMSEDDISQPDTFEEAGLEVQLAVRSESYREFKEKAQQVFRYFDPQPNVIGSGEYKVDVPEVVMAGPGYELVAGHGNSHAIMGVVAYPLDAGSVKLTSVGRDFISSTALDVRFEVGEIEITAGREELSYDQKTKNTISARVDSIMDDLTRRIFRDVMACETEFAARRYYGKFLNRFPALKRLFPSSAILYRGRMIDGGHFRINLREDFKGLTFLHYSFDYSKPSAAIFSSDRSLDVSLPANDNLTLIIDDMRGVHTVTRVRQYHEDHPDADVFVIRYGDQEQLDAFLARMEGVTPILISTLPKSPVQQRQPTSVLKLSAYEKKSGYNIKRDSWERTIVEPAEGGVFVRTLSGSIQNDAGERVSNFSSLYGQAIKLDLFKPTDNELYSIPKSLAANFTEEDGWVDFFSLIRAEFSRIMEEQKWGNDLAKIQALKRFSDAFPKVSGERPFLEMLSKRLPENHALGKFVTKWSETLVPKDYVQHLSMSATLGIPIPMKGTHDLVSLWKESAKDYPMLNYVLSISRWDRQEDRVANETAQYISLVDKNCVPTKV